MRGDRAPRLAAWQQLEVWPKSHRHFLAKLDECGQLEADIVLIDSTQIRAHGGGESTGPSPVHRGHSGTKYSVLTDANGVPLVFTHAPAGTSDHAQIIPTVLKLEELGFDLNAPDSAPDLVVADAGYDSEATRGLLGFLGMNTAIRRRKAKHGSGLGRVRWVVERTIGWLKGWRRLRLRYDRLDLIMDGWQALAASIICHRMASKST